MSPATVYLPMSAIKRLQPTEAVGGGGEPKRKPPAEFDTCNFLIETVSPEFDPKSLATSRLLHHRKQDPIRICGILSYPELPTQGRVWSIED